MTKLSVNVNKIATLRNARGGDVPNLLRTALDIEQFGAGGITVHPRPDERHIRYTDVHDLKANITTELNIEGYPSSRFIQLVMEVKPAQVTLVPDKPDQLTSNAGWEVSQHEIFLTNLMADFREHGIRSSIFIGTNLREIELAKKVGADRVELYTEPYASMYSQDREKAVSDFIRAGKFAKSIGLGLNAGHDLSLENLSYLHQCLPELDEVSIGHALIADALYLGLETTVKRYLACLK